MNVYAQRYFNLQNQNFYYKYLLKAKSVHLKKITIRSYCTQAHTTHNLDLAIYFLRAETEDLYIA